MKFIRRRFSLSRCPSYRDACHIDKDGNGTISLDELATYMEKNARLWAMLAVNLGLPEQQCRDIATTVAYKLAKNIDKKTMRALPSMDEIDTNDFHASHNSSSSSSLQEQDREPTLKEISRFLDFVKTPHGEQEFFHRTVFCTYDQDENGYLDADELDGFLDVFYEAGSIFAGDARLPPSKFLLKLEVLVSLDTDGDGRLTFPELRSLISGGAQSIPTGSNHGSSSSKPAARTAHGSNNHKKPAAKRSVSMRNVSNHSHKPAGRKSSLSNNHPHDIHNKQARRSSVA